MSARVENEKTEYIQVIVDMLVWTDAIDAQYYKWDREHQSEYDPNRLPA